jgi:hypothetical protein
MTSTAILAEFFGWCTLIGIGIYLLTIVGVTLFRGMTIRTNAKIFSIDEDDVSRISFQYVGAFKLLLTLLFFVPYVALKIMA